MKKIYSKFLSSVAPALTLLMAGILAISCIHSPDDNKPDEPDLVLATDGATAYQIVLPDNPQAVDSYAAGQLSLYLGQITGVEFPTVHAGTMNLEKPAIFVGLSSAATEKIGKDVNSRLQDGEYAARSLEDNIFLYGGGMHGTLCSVMDFLETSLGWRWYSVFELPVIPEKPTLTIKPFRRQSRMAFQRRKVDVQRSLDFFYQMGMNMGFDQRTLSFRSRGITNYPAGIVSALNDELDSGHSFFHYIPPSEEALRIKPAFWLSQTNYFETNPEYFTMNENGVRLRNKQLCFSNPALRSELTRNIEKRLERAHPPCILGLGAMDTPGAFCHCPGCKALEEKYDCIGGPFYDYLFELCDTLEKSFPGVMVKTLAYRRSQTQKPPALPPGKRMPDNLIIDFAPIEDNYFADWSHPDPRIQETLADLQAWSRITSNLDAWLYPNPWGSGIFMPLGNVERLITNMRLMHAAGVKGVKTDHCSFHQRGGWSELQAYLFYKLCRNINADTDALTVEFTDYMYGPAAPLLRQYLSELESRRKSLQNLPPGVSYRSYYTDDTTFPYLTTANIHRWQALFDMMERDLQGRPRRELVNLRLVRRELDFATLWKWFELNKDFPEYFADHKNIVHRIEEVNAEPALPAPEWEGKSINRLAHALGTSAMRDFVTIIEAGGEIKPLPQELADADPSKVRQFVPNYPNNRPGRAFILDPEAAFGYAVPVGSPDMPLTMGFYQHDLKTTPLKLALGPDDITPGRYQTHRLGEITITSDCRIWFARSWTTKIELGDRLYEPGAENLWEAWVSLKALGPAYGGDAGEELLPLSDRKYGGDPQNMVLIDRIILVPKSKSQFADP